MASHGFTICLLTTLALCLQPSAAKGQAAPSSEPNRAAPHATARSLPRFDLAGGLGWAGGRQQLTPSDDNGSWYHDAVWYGASAGFYGTEHLKVEFEIGATGEGTLYSWEEEAPVRSPVSGMYVSREHTLSGRRFAATAVYQFRHNAWVHPFLGAGLELERRRHDIVTLSYSAASVSESFESATDTTVRPMLTAGVKAYLTERVFFRSDVVASFGKTLERVLVRCGFGVDF